MEKNYKREKFEPKPQIPSSTKWPLFWLLEVKNRAHCLHAVTAHIRCSKCRSSTYRQQSCVFFRAQIMAHFSCTPTPHRFYNLYFFVTVCVLSFPPHNANTSFFSLDSYVFSGLSFFCFLQSPPTEMPLFAAATPLTPSPTDVSGEYVVRGGIRGLAWEGGGEGGGSIQQAVSVLVTLVQLHPPVRSCPRWERGIFRRPNQVPLFSGQKSQTKQQSADRQPTALFQPQ